MRAIGSLVVLGLSFLLSSALAQGPTAASPVVADVLKLSDAKVDEGVIVTYLQKTPRGNVSAADLLTLHSNGLSSRVLLALLDSSVADRAPTEAAPTVQEPAPAQPAAQSVEVSSPIVEVPYVNYVSAPVYVGPGSLYYYDDGWWGFGLGLGIGWGWGYASWGWNSCYPWYGYGWYPYYGYYYAHCGSGHHHGGDHHGHDGHHGHGGHDGNGGHDGYAVRTPQRGGGQSASVGRSTVAASNGNPNRGVAASRASSPASGAVAGRQPTTASRAGGIASANASSRNNVNTLPGGRGVESQSGNTISRSSTSVANGRMATASMAQNAGARSGVAPTRPVTSSGGVQVATTVRRSVDAPTRSAPSSYSSAGTVAPRYTGSPSASSGYQVGQRAPSGSTGAGGNYASARSYSVPAANYSVGRSSGGASMGGFSSGGGSRGFSGGSGGFSGGGGRGGASVGGRR